MHDLLHDPLIGVRTPAGAQRLSLPGLLAALSLAIFVFGLLFFWAAEERYGRD